MSNTNPARGMRDFLPDQIRKRNYVIDIIREVYEKYGFEPLETPTIENLSTLTNKYGEEGDQLMFKVLKRGEKLKKQLKRDDAKENDLTDLALRYDLTVPLARVIANYRHELPKFFKRYQIQPVWRADRPARGRYREFYQCDVDAIGSKSMLVEAELCSAVNEILERLGFDDFVLRVNHRKILTGILEAVGIPEVKYTDALISIDKVDKVGLEGVSTELIKRGISERSSEQLVNFIREAKKTPVTLKRNIETLTELDKIEISKNKAREELNKIQINALRTVLVDSEGGIEGVREIETIVRYIGFGNYPNFQIDPTLARGLSYYTGAIFEVVLTNGDFAGSIAGGGRYDGLIGMFGKEEIPAVGMSLGLERILLVMEERGLFEKPIKDGKLKLDAADVLVTVWNEETAGESLKIANELRQKGLRVTVYPQSDKPGKQLKYADQIGVKFACIIHETDLDENKVRVKNMKTRDQEYVKREEIAEKIASM